MKPRWTGPVIATVDMLLALFIVALALIQPPVERSKAGDKPICMLAVDITWEEGANTDVDLWVQGPNDKPVGYSSRAGRVFDLVRDDLGSISDDDGNNSERACARNLPDGEYVVNLHLYRNDPRKGFPVPVKIEIILVDLSEAATNVMFEGEGSLKGVGQEITVVRFEIEDGKWVTGSEHSIQKPLRNRTTIGGGGPVR